MTTTSDKTQEAFIIFNPMAGLTNGQVMKLLIENRFNASGWNYQIFQTEKDTDVTAIVKERVQQGVDLIVAVGGDGTVAAVAAGMVNSSIPMGIIPTGTWNAIARRLMLPANPIRAIAVMTGKHKIRDLDMMSIGDSLHAMNLSVGFSSLMSKSVSREKKRRFGNLAYFKQLLKQIIGLQLKKYTITADGKIYKVRASEIMVANYGVVGLNMLENMLDIHPDDGKVDVLILKTRTILDIPSIFWNSFIRRKKRTPKLQQLIVNNTVTIDTKPSMDVQADGEMIGKTPVTLSIFPRCVHVIVP